MDLKVWEIFISKPVLAALIAQLSSQIFKIFIPLFKGKPPDLRKFLNYGDIPSAHTAFIAAVSISIGLEQGWKSPLFALAGVVASILIYDIIKLRKTVELNMKMTRKLMEKNILPITDRIPQFKGHTGIEVIAGAVWGTMCAFLVSLFFSF